MSNVTARITVHLDGIEWATFSRLSMHELAAWVDEDFDIVTAPLDTALTTVMGLCRAERDAFENRNSSAQPASATESATDVTDIVDAGFPCALCGSLLHNRLQHHT